MQGMGQFEVEQGTHGDVPDDGDYDIGWSVVGTVVVQFGSASFTRIGHLQVGSKQSTLSTLGTAALQAIADCWPQGAVRAQGEVGKRHLAISVTAVLSLPQGGTGGRCGRDPDRAA